MKVTLSAQYKVSQIDAAHQLIIIIERVKSSSYRIQQTRSLEYFVGAAAPLPGKCGESCLAGHEILRHGACLGVLFLGHPLRP